MKTAVIIKTGKKLYTSDAHSFDKPTDGWFSHPDGNSYECSFVMDNKEFLGKLKSKEIKLMETP